MNFKKRVLLAVACLMLSACVTISTQLAGRKDPIDQEAREEFCRPCSISVPRVYSGVAGNLCSYREAKEFGFFLLIDLPFSAIADTLILPFTIPAQAKRGSICDAS